MSHLRTNEIFRGWLFQAAVSFFIATATQALPPTLPTIPAGTYNITNYGGIGNGVATNTTAISNAINAANVAGGGTVVIPAGTYLSGPIVLKSKIRLQLDSGALLKILPYGSYPGAPYTNANATADFISGTSLTDVEVSGGGAIDGQGFQWWNAMDTNAFLDANLDRPVMIRLTGCNRQYIQGVTLSNSPMFHLAFSSSAGNITVKGVTINAPATSHNTDACDVSGTNILVQDCNISVGDDDFTCGGGTSDVLLTNNAYGTGHGVSIGSYTSPSVSNITVINCTFNGTDNGIRLKSQRDRGGDVHNLKYLNLSMTNVAWPLLIYSYYEYGLGALTGITPSAANDVATTNGGLGISPPMYHDITFSNITATMGASTRPPLMVWGLPELTVSNVTFQNINITSSSSRSPGVYNATGIKFQDCQFNLPSGNSTLQLYNADVVVTNTTSSSAVVKLDGLTTTAAGNSLALYNSTATVKNTNAIDSAPLILGGSTFTVSNHLSFAAAQQIAFVLGTNASTIVVRSNLVLRGMINVTAGNGFANSNYTLFTYGQTLATNNLALGNYPSNHTYQIDTNTTGQVKLIVSAPALSAPSNVTAKAADQLVTVSWATLAGATSYHIKRSTTSGMGYSTLAYTSSTNYLDTDVTNSTTYYYLVAGINGSGVSANSSEVNATPHVSNIVFDDTFDSSTLNSASPAAPTINSTSYEMFSSKAWNPTPTIGPDRLTFGIAATTSGSVEVQALFTNIPVALTTTGDALSMTITFTNRSGLLTQSSALGFGLYNSGQNYPVSGGLNGTATTSSSTAATGNAQTWVGYVGQLSFTNASSQILTRKAQTGSFNNNQDVVTSGSGSSSYSNPSATTVGSASAAASLVLVTGSTYTAVFKISLTASNTLGITNSLYTGNDTNGTLLSQFGSIASGANYLTNSFDAFAIGWRATANSNDTTIDISRITVTANKATAPVNHAPVANTDKFGRIRNLPLSISFASLLTNDTDADLNSLTVTGVSATTNGITLATNATNIFYTNAAPVNDQFTYTISDGHSGSATGTVNLYVQQLLDFEADGLSGTNTLAFAGVPGRQYALQYSTNSSLTQWAGILTNTLPTDGIWRATNTTVYPSKGYYRLVIP